MSILGATELQTIRAGCASANPAYTKTQLNAAAQAVENWLTSNSAAVSGVIDTATSPVVLSNAQKKLLVAYVLDAKFKRDS